MNLPGRALKHGLFNLFQVKEAIILAGGFGTRLKHIVKDLPKSMAPVRGKPLLEYILEYLTGFGVEKIILATGYMHEKVEHYFGDRYKNSKLVYSVEKEPLGTGGALSLAADFVDTGYCLALNGDTLFNLNIDDFEDHFLKHDPVLSVALKPMRNFERYGSVTLEGSRIVSFNEKRFCGNGFINGGVYILKKEWLVKNAPGRIFSFEKDILEKRVGVDLLTGYISDTYFIDIGVPEDYRRAVDELPDLSPGS